MGVSVCLCACNAHVAGTYICLRHCYTHKNTYHGSDFVLVYAKKFYLQLRKVSLSSKEKHNSVFLSIRVPSEMDPPPISLPACLKQIQQVAGNISCKRDGICWIEIR